MVNNFFIPIFYTTIIGRNDLQKNKRISILLAGILMNICFAGMGLLVTNFTVGLIHDILVFIFIINFLMAISNMTVLLRTDGYFILEEIFEIINLDHKTIIYFKSIFTKNNCLKFQKSYLIYTVLLFISIIIFLSLGICLAKILNS